MATIPTPVLMAITHTLMVIMVFGRGVRVIGIMVDEGERGVRVIGVMADGGERGVLVIGGTVDSIFFS